jgi:hypothetical protein
MQWLLHGSMTPATAAALARHEHITHDISEAGLPPDAPPESALEAASRHQWDIITTEPALGAALFAGRAAFGRSIVLLLVGAGDVEQDDAVDRLFARYKRLSPGRLYTVTESRVKVRQLPTTRRPVRST